MALSTDPEKCDHYQEYQEYVENVYEDWDGRIIDDSRWEWTSREYLHDIDLHRMKCEYCGGIEYYSGRARAHYEGETHDRMIVDSNERYLRDKKDRRRS